MQLARPLVDGRLRQMVLDKCVNIVYALCAVCCVCVCVCMCVGMSVCPESINQLCMSHQAELQIMQYKPLVDFSLMA